MKSIKKPWLGIGKSKPNGEVLVIINMGNGTTPETNTIVTALVRHEGGKLIWGKEGLYNTESEAEYRAKLGKKKNADTQDQEEDCESRIAKGLVTKDQYKKEYFFQNFKKLSTHHREHDLEVTKDPGMSDIKRGEKLQKRVLDGKARAALIEKLSTNYTEQLKLTQELGDKLLLEANLELGVIKSRHAEMAKHPGFKSLLKIIVEGGRSIKPFIEMVAKNLDIDTDEVEEYLAYLDELRRS